MSLGQKLVMLRFVYNRIMVGLKHNGWIPEKKQYKVYNRIMVGLKQEKIMGITPRKNSL